jgi:hypothetical protein
MRRLTTLLAIAAVSAAIPATASAEPPVWAGEKPGTYGSCVAWEAMFGDQPVPDFIERTSPVTVLGFNGEKVVGPTPADDEITMGCVIDFGGGGK